MKQAKGLILPIRSCHSLSVDPTLLLLRQSPNVHVAGCFSRQFVRSFQSMIIRSCAPLISFIYTFRWASGAAAWTNTAQVSSTLAMSSTSSPIRLTENDNLPDLPPVSSTAKRIFWVRHGEVVNPGGDRPVYYGAMDVPLSELGQAEARAAGKYLKENTRLSHVFSSPLSRAIYGAEQVALAQSDGSKEGLESVKVLDGFKELDRGDWCGKTKEEIGDDFMRRFDACDELVTPDNGESYNALKARVLKARDAVLQALQPGTSACVVSHLQVTRCVLSDALGIPTDKMVNLKIATASLTCIDYETSMGDDRGNEDGAGITQQVQYQSFKPQAGLATARDGAN
ncbi:predicted protein [Phaeodactylum tricornutum CCAP 1055/1]|jgi:broad specificity phosphatase PhoE|uniref:Phosphoglycerate mutase n=1 Tax=Phaeodactylum tricornutum (strain CCAP 1055/1) TaxID=556484 RepID=B7G0K6_PHATC|nr:predicted protein [Phaeodactylum tricornutum CCAP 1055/1]EEC47900.1 predicted protein [Phaeodactylum tricornutum CCAP 1055/1]|eukprot:XP_002180492.1 predicted protein [Phaeodactylum tricornutum CCAP 1055/1]